MNLLVLFQSLKRWRMVGFWLGRTSETSSSFISTSIDEFMVPFWSLSVIAIVEYVPMNDNVSATISKLTDVSMHVIVTRN